jgi:hypothetical protein
MRENETNTIPDNIRLAFEEEQRMLPLFLRSGMNENEKEQAAKTRVAIWERYSLNKDDIEQLRNLWNTWNRQQRDKSPLPNSVKWAIRKYVEVKNLFNR